MTVYEYSLTFFPQQIHIAVAISHKS